MSMFDEYSFERSNVYYYLQQGYDLSKIARAMGHPLGLPADLRQLYDEEKMVLEEFCKADYNKWEDAMIKAAEVLKAFEQDQWYSSEYARIADDIIDTYFGGDVNQCNIHGQSPLFIAVKDQDYEFVELFLKRGANPNESSPLHNEWTLLEWSLLWGNLEIQYAMFFALLRASADVDIYNQKDRHRALHFPLRMWNGIFCQTFYLFGGKVPSHESKSWIQLNVLGLIGPLSLSSLCRLSVRKALGRERLGNIKELPLPQYLICFLNYEFILWELRKLVNCRKMF